MKILDAFLCSIFPKICQHCEKVLSPYSKNALCKSCEKILKIEDEQLNDKIKNKDLILLSNVGQNYYGFINFGFHKSLLKKAKLDGNYKLYKQLLRIYAQNAATKIKNNNIQLDLIIPVPNHFLSLLHRGFSPSFEFALELSKYLQCKTCFQTLKFSKLVKKQAKLSKINRIKNLHLAFKAKKTSISDKSILLVDDILTTGTTMREAKIALYNAGAKNVYLSTLAISPLKMRLSKTQ
jgi:competence protein ComFC